MMQRLLSLRLASKRLSTSISTAPASTTSSSQLPHSRFCNSSNSIADLSLSPSRLFSNARELRPRNACALLGPLISNPTHLPAFSSYSKSLSLLNCIDGLYKASFFRQSSGFRSGFDYPRRNWKSWFRRLTDDNVVLGLIITNVAVFMLWQIADHSFMMKNFMISLDNFKGGRLHTLLTSAFSHMEMGHLISNMIGLYFFGHSIGRNFGPEFLLKLYLAGAFGGSVFYLVHHAWLASQSKVQGMSSIDPSRKPGLGASGAVNAIMLLDIFLFPKATLYLDFIFPVPAILLGVFLIGKDLLRIIEGDSHISGSAHLGGAVVAAIAWARIRKRWF